MNQFNFGWIPLIQQELRKFFASKAQGSLADTALQPGNIGTSVQPYDAALDAVSGITPSAIGLNLLAASTETIGRNTIQAASLNMLGLRNRIINGSFSTNQYLASTVLTAGANLTYVIDRWWGAATGANITGQAITADNDYGYQFTGASGCTGIQFGQRIEADFSADLAGKTVTLSVELANSALSTVTWTAFRANTRNTFGSLSSPSKTQIATGTFTGVSSQLTRYSAQINIPPSAVHGIEIVFSVGSQTTGTWTVKKAQLEIGNQATEFEMMNQAFINMLCRRYYQFSRISPCVKVSNSSLYAGSIPVSIDTQLRATPTALVYSDGRSNPGNVLVNASTLSSSFVLSLEPDKTLIWSNAALSAVGDNFTGHIALSAEL